MPEFHDFSDGGPFAGVRVREEGSGRRPAIVVDVTTDFKGQDPRTIWVAPNDVHPNAKGHAIVADAVVKNSILALHSELTNRKKLCRL